jgi:hypothetical protein
MLVAVLDPADRAANPQCQPAGANLFRQQNSLVSEAAADIRCYDADLSMIEAEALGETRAHDVRQLCRRMEDELPEPRVTLRDERAPLERRHALARGAQGPADPDRRRPRYLGEIVVDEGFERDIVAPRLVHQRRVRSPRSEHVGDDRQFIEIDSDLCGKVFRLGAGLGDAHSDHLADMTHLPCSEDRLLGDLETWQAGDCADGRDAGEIVVNEHTVPAPRRLFDPAKAGMRERAAQERNLQHAWQSDIGDELAAATQKAVIFLAQKRCADAFPADGRVFRRHQLPQRLNSASAPRRCPNFAVMSARTRAISFSSSAIYASSSAIPNRLKSFG